MTSNEKQRTVTGEMLTAVTRDQSVQLDYELEISIAAYIRANE